MKMLHKRRIVRLVVWLVLTWVAMSNSLLIGYSVGAARHYIELRAEGVSHSGALCETTEFADNILRSAGFTDREARQTQHELYQAHCRGELK